MNKRKIIVIALSLIGVILITYPFVSNIIRVFTQTTVISSYENTVKNLSEDEKKEKIENAELHNEELEKDAYIDISLKEKQEELPSYMNLLDLGETMGYIVIPKIEVNLPIYHGIGEDVLQNGVGHIDSSSLPIGGKGTHAVIAGHTGLAKMKIFDNLNDLVIGDIFYIKILEKILKYKVDRKEIVEPYDTETIKIEEDKDYVTLVTCVPKYINSHRLLVRGERVETEEIVDKTIIENTYDSENLKGDKDTTDEKIKEKDILNEEINKANKWIITTKIVKLAILILLFLIIVFIIMLYKIKRKE